MDGDGRTHDEGSERPSGPGPGDRVGLGRVIEDHAVEKGRARAPDDVDEASDESFPASDPTGFAPRRPSPRAEDPADAERPGPGDPPRLSGRPSA